MTHKKTKIIVVLFITLLIASYSQAFEATVYKSPYCGCCSNWSDNLEDNGFTITTEKASDMETIKDNAGVPHQVRSCHTAVIEGYVIEGHVPASDIMRMLKERPDIVGLAVPDMPVGSPGMEQGSRKDSFNVLGILKDGSTFIYNSY
jgi:hypothetical protein